MLPSQKRVTHMCRRAHEDNNLTLGPHPMYSRNEIDIALLKLRTRHIIRTIIIIRPNINHHHIRRGMCGKIPQLGLVTPNLDRAAARVTRVVPLVSLPAEVAVALFVDEADPRVGFDAEIGVAEPGREVPRPRGDAFVGGVLPGGEGVADDFYCLAVKG